MESFLPSFAKVNLFLKVLRKRDDGYHDIVSLVDLISLSDSIRIKETEEDQIVVKRISGEMPEGRENVIYRAVELLKQRFSIKKGIVVEVKKRIPLGAGLGGGSSNAATVIRALNSLWDLKISPSELLEIGKSIGADVPLFLYGKACIIRGVGEKITPVTLPRIWYLIVYPEVEMKSKEVYSRVKIVLTKNGDDIKLKKNFSSLEEVVRILENDLEETVIEMCPKIGEIKDLLTSCGAKGALVTGSGSSVFGCFEDKKSAERAARSMAPYGRVFVACSI